MKWMKLKTERYRSYIDPLTVEFFQNNGTGSISVILLTNGRKDRRKDGQTYMLRYNSSFQRATYIIVWNDLIIPIWLNFSLCETTITDLVFIMHLHVSALRVCDTQVAVNTRGSMYFSVLLYWYSRVERCRQITSSPNP